MTTTDFGRASGDHYKRQAHEFLDKVCAGEPVRDEDVDWALRYLGEPVKEPRRGVRRSPTTGEIHGNQE